MSWWIVLGSTFRPTIDAVISNLQANHLNADHVKKKMMVHVAVSLLAELGASPEHIDAHCNQLNNQLLAHVPQEEIERVKGSLSPQQRQDFLFKVLSYEERLEILAAVADTIHLDNIRLARIATIIQCKRPDFVKYKNFIDGMSARSGSDNNKRS